jgi:hypothetical protein
MPKRTDLQSILILGSGPIVIGQAAELDDSGTQTVRGLREEGYRVILVNSAPATITTDPDPAADAYIEADWSERPRRRSRTPRVSPTPHDCVRWVATRGIPHHRAERFPAVRYPRR